MRNEHAETDPKQAAQRAVQGMWAICAAAAWLASLVWMHLRLCDLAFDDAYIHLRIARNLLHHGHAFFNPGEQVMATSSPLWTVLLALLHAPNHPAMLPVAEALLLWCCGVLAVCIGMDTVSSAVQGRRMAIVGAAGLLTTVLVLTSSLGQMETPLAVALLLAAWWSARRDAGWTLPLLALAACTRLELLPLLAVAGAAWLLKGKRALPAAIAVLLVGAAAVWTWVQFHVLLPNSMHAKRLVYHYTVKQAAQQFMSFRLSAELPVLALLLFIAMAVWGVRRATPLQRTTPVLPLLAIVWGLCICMQYIANRTVLFEWYRPLFTVPLVLGLLLCPVEALRPRRLRGLRELRRFRGLRTIAIVCRITALLYVMALPLIAAEHAVAAAMQHTPLATSRIDAGDSARVQEYLQIGTVLRSTCPGARLLTPEIGALGWAFGGYVLDAFGIASPGALHYQPLTGGAAVGGIPAAYVIGTLPDVMVSYSALDTEVRESPELTSRYERVNLPPSPRSDRGGALDAGWRGSSNLDVWLRRDGTCPVRLASEALHRKLD